MGATGILNGLLALLVGAILTWITDIITTPLLEEARAVGSDPVANQSTSWIAAFLNNQPVMFLFYFFFSLIALSVFQREVLRG